jgi:hypothetical protein
MPNREHAAVSLSRPPIAAGRASSASVPTRASLHAAGDASPVRRRASILALSGVLMSLALGGCYERVIRATGPAADRQRISEPYQQNYEVDEWLFGTKVPDVRKRP